MVMMLIVATFIVLTLTVVLTITFFPLLHQSVVSLLSRGRLEGHCFVF